MNSCDMITKSQYHLLRIKEVGTEEKTMRWPKQRLEWCTWKEEEKPQAKEYRQPLRAFIPGSARHISSSLLQATSTGQTLPHTRRRVVGLPTPSSPIPTWIMGKFLSWWEETWCLCWPWIQIALSISILSEINFIFWSSPPQKKSQINKRIKGEAM